MSNHTDVHAVRCALSLLRIGTYDRSVVTVGDQGPAAVTLYDWNAQISGAFMAPLHICEVVTRNTVSDAVTAVYGEEWPWSRVFEMSLPSPLRGYSLRTDLIQARGRQRTTGKMIPELKFVFWQRMFTGRHDERLWKTHLRRVLPNLDAAKPLAELRQSIYNDLEGIRLLRNRIAHHEPIFRRDLARELDKVAVLIGYRCQKTADWMMANQQVAEFLPGKPPGQNPV